MIGAFAPCYESKARKRLGIRYYSVKHRVREYVDGEADTNGIESFWAMRHAGLAA